MNRLCRTARKKTRVVVGLMSGTSHDGVDAVAARISGNGPECRVSVLGMSRLAYPKALREKVARAFLGDTELVCSLNFELGEFFAKAALKGIKEAGLQPADVDAIGSHGQTIYHIPPFNKGGTGGILNPPQSPFYKGGSTLQIGEGAVIAARTGVLTVSDFRPADIAAGGQGAPLVPYADWVLFRKKGEVTALQNIGGISNVTVVTENLDGVIGFDTGPGCSLLDEAVKILSGGKLVYDKDGRWARSGEPIPELLGKLLTHPYFVKEPPKSTGRELFGRKMAEDIVKRAKGANAEDILCTLTHFTARTIYNAYRDFVFPRTRVDRIALAGGGARNGFLFELIKGLFEANPPTPPLTKGGQGGISVILIDQLGVPAEAREALCFAILANETISGIPSNVPAATGAQRPAILGKISF